jgi:hypothetical protein
MNELGIVEADIGDRISSRRIAILANVVRREVACLEGAVQEIADGANALVQFRNDHELIHRIGRTIQTSLGMALHHPNINKTTNCRGASRNLTRAAAILQHVRGGRAATSSTRPYRSFWKSSARGAAMGFFPTAWCVIVIRVPADGATSH